MLKKKVRGMRDVIIFIFFVVVVFRPVLFQSAGYKYVYVVGILLFKFTFLVTSPKV